MGLKRIGSVQEAPVGAYLIYNMTGGIYYIRPEEYPLFSVNWVGYEKSDHLTIDLASVGKHSVILDLDYTPAPESTQTVSSATLEHIESILKMLFIPTVPNFTYIIALRSNHAGIHIHLPEFLIAHDDYILLCESLALKLGHGLSDGSKYVLDVLRNATLSGSAKPDTAPYRPVRVVYVDEIDSYTIDLPITPKSDVKMKSFKRRKDNERSLFRHLLICNPSMWRTFLRQVMMPVPTQFDSVHTLSYTTVVGPTPSNDPSEWRDVAMFTNRKKETGYVRKSTRMAVDDSNQFFKMYHYLKLNAFAFQVFETNNYALRAWFRIFATDEPDHSHIPAMLLDVHQTLQLEHPVLSRDPNPLKTILQYNEGYYFIPVFYTLCRHCGVDSHTLAGELYRLLDEPFHRLLDKIRRYDPRTIASSTGALTLNTIHYCGNNLNSRPATMREKLQSIVRHNETAILSVTTAEQLMDLLRTLQERHFPMQVLRYRNSHKKTARCVWNCLKDNWQEMAAGECSDHMNNLWTSVRSYLCEYRRSGGMAGPGEKLVEKFTTTTVVSTIMSDTAMECRDVEMDTHRWLVRLNGGGMLDLLTGHVGAIVPELYLSHRALKLDKSRADLMRLCDPPTDLHRLYLRLTDRGFFLRYLKLLFEDATDNLVSTLHEMVMRDHDGITLEPLEKSMLRFYVHLCKYMSFDYDMLMYLLDVLASVLISTNYERKFFVLKGQTRNGKSKLFELMSRIMGDYHYSIDSDNMNKTRKSSASEATPQLASTVFSCRIVTIEELAAKLSEDRVKKLTGDSFVTFRNMYEQGIGGIPNVKVFASTNHYPDCTATVAFSDRIVAIPFEAEFDKCPPETTSGQITANTYFKEFANVTGESYEGGFFMLYYHMKHRMDPEDGLLHYRNEPDCVVEFTEDYLMHTDVYVQFKVQMDVQESPGGSTTSNEVRSAVRQFLKLTKNTSFHESDIIIRFEKEFGGHRRTDIRLGAFTHANILDAGAVPLKFSGVLRDEPPAEATTIGPVAKQFKRDETPEKAQSTMVYYDGVVINNMKKTSDS